jgi:hypothetical protein
MSKLIGHFVETLAPLTRFERPLLPRVTSPFDDDAHVQLERYATQVQGDALEAEADNRVAHALSRRARVVGFAVGVAVMGITLARRGSPAP